MRILIATLGSAGDVHPFIGIALALQERGHDVVFLTNEYFEPVVTKSGLDFVAVGTKEEYQSFTDNPELLRPWRSLQILAEALVDKSLESVYHHLSSRINSKDTVMVASTLALGARLVREKLGTPLVTVHLAPAALRSIDSPPNLAGIRMPARAPRFMKSALWWALDKFLIDPMLCPGLNRFRNELGLSPISRLGAQWANSPDRILGLFPPWFTRLPNDWPKATVLTGFPLFDEAHISELDSELDEFLEQGEAPIVFTLASWMRHGRSYFSEAVEICERLGCRGILLSRSSDQIPGRLPQGIRHYPYVPLSQLLPKARAFVHQGGIGCCAQGLKAGVPQLIGPIAFDQYDNGDHIKALGVGDSVSLAKPPLKLAERLTQLLESPSVEERCQTLANLCEGEEAIEQTCRVIEQMI